MKEKMEFPKTLCGMELTESVEDVYAFYLKTLGYGFKHGLEIAEVYPKNLPEKTLMRAQHLSGNNWGKGTWLIMRADYFHNLEEALNNLNGVKVKPPKPKRKLIVQPAMTAEEVKAYWGNE